MIVLACLFGFVCCFCVRVCVYFVLSFVCFLFVLFGVFFGRGGVCLGF